jgi:hypothetical protein
LDHTPIITTISTHITTHQKPPKLHNSQTNWEAFRNQIEENLRLNTPLKTAKDIEEATAEFNNVIQKAAWSATPDNKPQTKYPEYLWEFRDQIKEKRKLRRRWQISRHPEDKYRYNEAARKLKNRIKRIKEETFQTYLQGLTATADTDYSLWKATKRLKQQTQRIPQIRNADQTWARGEKEKANTFAGHLEKTIKPNDLPKNEGLETKINKALKEPLQIIQPIKFLTPKEIRNIIREDLNPRKAPGYDLITGRILKEMPRKGIAHLTTICNTIIRMGYFPVQWKVAQTVMILKPGKPLEEASSYRLISLLPIMSKIFEKAVLKRLCPILEENRILSDHQFGF